jgi:hypothetical protein
VGGERKVLAMKARERAALLLSADLRSVVRHVEGALSDLRQQVTVGWDAEERARRQDAMTELEAALDLLLGQNRRR